jgi:hypothetical protein
MAPSKTTRDSRKKCAVQATKTRCTIVQNGTGSLGQSGWKIRRESAKQIVQPLGTGKALVRELKPELR